MAKTEFKLKLVRPARKLGGDRYECGKKGDVDFMVFYIPQFISRVEDKVREELLMTLT